LTFANAKGYRLVKQGDVLQLQNLRKQIRAGRHIRVENVSRKKAFQAAHALSGRQIDVLMAGGLINWMKPRLKRRR